MKKQLLLIPATFALTFASAPFIPGVTPAMVYADAYHDFYNGVFTFGEIYEDFRVLTFYDKNGTLSDVKLEIYNEDGTKKIGNGLTGRAYAVKGTDSIAISEDYTRNSIYTTPGKYLAVYTVRSTTGQSFQHKETFTVTQKSINTRNNTHLIAGKPVIKTAITNDSFVATVSDDKKMLSRIYAEIYNANGTKKLGDALVPTIKSTSKTGSITISDAFYNNPFYAKSNTDMTYKMKITVLRTNGSKSFEFVEFKVKAANTDPIKFSYSVDPDNKFTYYVSSKAGNVKTVKTEIYDGLGKTKLGNAVNSNLVASTGKETLAVGERFSSNKIYTEAGDYYAKSTIALKDGRAFVKWFKFKVAEKAITSNTNTSTTASNSNIIAIDQVNDPNSVEWFINKYAHKLSIQNAEVAAYLVPDKNKEDIPTLTLAVKTASSLPQIYNEQFGFPIGWIDVYDKDGKYVTSSASSRITGTYGTFKINLESGKAKFNKNEKYSFTARYSYDNGVKTRNSAYFNVKPGNYTK